MSFTKDISKEIGILTTPTPAGDGTSKSTSKIDKQNICCIGPLPSITFLMGCSNMMSWKSDYNTHFSLLLVYEKFIEY